MERTIELGYWQIKLKAQQIRWLLAYLTKELETYTEWNPSSKEEWATQKESLSHLNPLVTLPYIKSGETVVSRPQAIMAAIAMKADRLDLLGKNVEQAIEIRALQDVVDDLRNFVWSNTMLTSLKFK